ncbi:uncharacterized protein METZ01_LOCUS267287 [marine metagenome]|uniref:Uncharacterized protein n=1 Tax=marine metagenome TaxID=408172 RepID=A0A382JT78_9ZZZZ
MKKLYFNFQLNKILLHVFDNIIQVTHCNKESYYRQGSTQVSSVVYLEDSISGEILTPLK